MNYVSEVLRLPEVEMDPSPGVVNPVDRLMTQLAMRAIDPATFRQKMGELHPERSAPMEEAPVRDLAAERQRLINTVEDLLENDFGISPETYIPLLYRAVELDERESPILIACNTDIEIRDLKKVLIHAANCGKWELVKALIRSDQFTVGTKEVGMMFLAAKNQEKWPVVLGLIKNKDLLPGFVSQLFNEWCANKKLDLLNNLANAKIPESAFKRQFEASKNDVELRAVLTQFAQYRELLTPSPTSSTTASSSVEPSPSPGCEK